MKHKFNCKMKDGSIYTMPNEKWQKAYDMKYANQDQGEIKRIFKDMVAKHWKKKTIPTKFGFDDKWENEYKNHAELGNEIMYIYIRAALMGVIFSEMTNGKGKVIGLDKDGKSTTYPKKR